MKSQIVDRAVVSSVNGATRGRVSAVAAIALAVGAWVGGCQSKPAETAGAVAPPLAQPVSPQAQANDVANEGSPDALRARMREWTRQADDVMRNRLPRAGDAGGGVADALRPEEMRLTPSVIAPPQATRNVEPPVQIAPLARPTVDSTPSNANQGAAIALAEPRPGAAAAAGAAVNSAAPAAAASKLLGDSGAGRAAAAMPPLDGAAPVAPPPAAVETGRLSNTELSLARHLRQYPKDVWAHLDQQLIEFVQDKPVPRMEALAKLGAEDRELLTAILDALTVFRQGLRADGNMLMSRKVRPLLEMADRIRAQADLVIPTVSLCSRVDGFGVYEPMEARFTAMREHPVLIYCEVENFSSHMNAQRFWETKLSQEVVLYTETGMPVWQDKTENIPDSARHRRHDFFIVKKTRFPANVTVGRYMLKVTVVDQQANRVTEATMPVQFVAGK